MWKDRKKYLKKRPVRCNHKCFCFTNSETCGCLIITGLLLAKLSSMFSCQKIRKIKQKNHSSSYQLWEFAEIHLLFCFNSCLSIFFISGKNFIKNIMEPFILEAKSVLLIHSTVERDSNNGKDKRKPNKYFCHNAPIFDHQDLKERWIIQENII